MKPIAIIVGIGLLTYLLFSWLFSEPDSNLEQEFNSTGPRLVALLAMLAFIGAGIWAVRPRLGEVAKAVIVWGGLFVLLLVGYALRDDFFYIANRTIGAVVPGYVVSGKDSVSVVRSPDGHFYLNANVDGNSIRFLVDTGASVTALRATDAARLGFLPNQLNYTHPVTTANGLAYVAPIEIPSFEIGDFYLSSVDATAFPSGILFDNLLGMNVLSEFRSWRIEGDRLILEP